jgi:hypothetical protein
MDFSLEIHKTRNNLLPDGLFQFPAADVTARSSNKPTNTDDSRQPAICTVQLSRLLSAIFCRFSRIEIGGANPVSQASVSDFSFP